MKLKDLLFRLFPRRFKNYITRRQLLTENFTYSSFSQFGEDIILDRYFAGKKKPGFFIDIGANHPYKNSNTYKFYLKGWAGINVDAIPGTKKLFNSIRPKDISLECGVSSAPGETNFYTFENSGFNTMDKVTAEQHCREFLVTVKNIIKVTALSLSQILDEHLPSGQIIDFMSIDVEGLDLEVLKSNNWEKYKPEVIVVECLREDYENIPEMKTSRYLAQFGYSFFAKTYGSYFFSLKKTK